MASELTGLVNHRNIAVSQGFPCLGISGPSNSLATIHSQIQHGGKFHNQVQLPHGIVNVPSEHMPIINIGQRPAGHPLVGSPDVEKVVNQQHPIDAKSTPFGQSS